MEWGNTAWDIMLGLGQGWSSCVLPYVYRAQRVSKGCTKQEMPKYIAELLWNMVHFSVQTKTLKFWFVCRNNWSEISLLNPHGSKFSMFLLTQYLVFLFSKPVYFDSIQISYG